MSEGDRKPGAGFPRTRRTLPLALLRAREVVMDRFRPLLQEHSITEQQWRVPRILQENSPQDASDLAQNAHVLGPSLMRIVKTLQTGDQIATQNRRVGGRRIRIGPTGEGEAFIRKIAPGSPRVCAEIEHRPPAGRSGNADLGAIRQALEHCRTPA